MLSQEVIACLSRASFWIPDWLCQSAWTEHAPFAFWLCEALRPRCFVELGTHFGFSYFAVCQAVKQLDLGTACYAIDTWLGDDHSGIYDETVYQAVLEQNQRKYSAFSSLCRLTFDEASSSFSEGSINLLHIDGCHSYEKVKHDYLTWLPKLAKDSVVIFHDAIEVRQGFGVKRFFEELAARHPSFLFPHGHGLGLVVTGEHVPEALLPLFKASNDGADQVRAIYAALGSNLVARSSSAERDGRIADLNGAVAERDARITDLNQAVGERDGRMADLNQAVGERDGRIADLNEALAERDKRIASFDLSVVENDARITHLKQMVVERDRKLTNLGHAVAERDERIASFSQIVADRENVIIEKSTRLASVQRSTSWKVGRIIVKSVSVLVPAKSRRYAVLRFLLRPVLKLLYRMAKWGWHAAKRLRKAIVPPNVLTSQTTPGPGLGSSVAESIVQAPGQRPFDGVKVRERSESENVGNRIFEHQQAEISREEILSNIQEFGKKPCISIVMPLFDPPKEWLEQAVRSLRAQYYQNWELCAVDDGSRDDRGRSYIEELSKSDRRVRLLCLERNSGISAASNKSLEMANGEFLALIDQDDEITPDALYWIVKEINENPDADFLYSDECKLANERDLFGFFFKPDWSPSLLINFMYTGHLTVYKASLVRQVGGFRSAYDFSQDYDLALRASEKAKCIRHVERILYLWRASATSGAGGGKQFAVSSNVRALKDWYARNGLKATAERRTCGNYSKLILENPPKVSIVVPTDSLENLRLLLSHLTSKTSYANIEIVPVTNSIVSEEILREFSYMDYLNISLYEEAFNFSKKCNKGAELATGDVLLFLNDDAYPLNPDWIERLLDVVMLPKVGGVSPAMLYENDSVQYAGMMTASKEHGLNGPAMHQAVFYNNTSEIVNPLVLRETSILCGACLAIRKDIFVEIGGFDSINTPNRHSDLDLSFRLNERGFLCVYTPYGVLRHKGTGGWVDNSKKDKADIFCLRKWSKYFSSDKYFTDSMKMYAWKEDHLKYKIFLDRPAAKKRSSYASDILLCSHELSRTGAPVALLGMARQLIDDGNFVVVTSPSDGPLRNDFTEAGATVIVDDSLMRARWQPEKEARFNGFWHFDSFIRAFDLVVVNTLCCHNIVSRYNNTIVPILWWIHEGKSTLNFSEAFMPRDLGKNVHVFCGSLFSRQALIDYHLEYQNEILNYGVEDAVSDYVPLENGRVRFMLAGSLEDRKGQDVLIDAITHLPEEYLEKSEFLFIGAVHQEHVLLKIKALCKRLSQVSYRDAVSIEELYQLYRHTDCVVCPSRDDPMPVVMAEAMMFSRVCICSDHTGTAYHITDGHNGYVIQSEDYLGLAARIMSVIDNPKKAVEIGKNGRKTFEEVFDMTVFKKDLRMLVARHASGPAR